MNTTKNFAVIKTGGKQYTVSQGDRIRVELLDAKPGEKVSFSEVMLICENGETRIGNPFVDGSSVTATVEDKFRADKIIVFKKKRRKGYKVTRGHRQEMLLLTIDDISFGTKKESTGASKKTTRKKAVPKAKPTAEKTIKAKKPKTSPKKATSSAEKVTKPVAEASAKTKKKTTTKKVDKSEIKE